MVYVGFWIHLHAKILLKQQYNANRPYLSFSIVQKYDGIVTIPVVKQTLNFPNMKRYLFELAIHCVSNSAGEVTCGVHGLSWKLFHCSLLHEFERSTTYCSPPIWKVWTVHTIAQSTCPHSWLCTWLEYSKCTTFQIADGRGLWVEILRYEQ